MQRYQNYTRILATGAPAPLAQIQVFDAGTVNAASIYSDNLTPPTPKASTFFADANGYFDFYAPPGRYDIRMSSGGIVTPFTWGDIPITDTGYVSVKDRDVTGDGVTDDSAALISAIANAANQTLFFPPGDYLIEDDVSVPQTVGLLFAAGAKITIASGVTLTITGPLIAFDTQIFDNDGTVILPNVGDIHARWFGAKGDGVTDDAVALQATYECCAASRNANLYLGAGIFAFGTKLTFLNASNSGITMIGVRDQAHQQGSIMPSCILRWIGGADSMIDVEETFCTFQDFAIDNLGTATNFLNVTQDGAGRVHLRRLSCLKVAGSNVFSNALVNIGYSNYDIIEGCEFAGCAPTIWKVTGPGPLQGYTTLYWINNIVDSNSNTPTGMKIFEFIDVNVELLCIQRSSFNTQNGGFGITVVDCTNIGAATSLINTSYTDCEYDGDASMDSSVKIMKLKNCNNAVVERATAFGGSGQMTSLFELDNSYLHIGAVHANAVNGPVVTLVDTDSKVFPRNCNLNPGNTRGLVIAEAAGVTDLTLVATSARVLAQKGDPGGCSLFRFIPPSAGVGYTVQVVDPTGAPPDGWGYGTVGQLIDLQIQNDTGGVIIVSFDTIFKMPSLTPTMPADGFSRIFRFRFNGTNWIGADLYGVDIPN